jgi:hypothetical protein
MSLVITKSALIYDLKKAIDESFTEIEVQDEIVRYIYVSASTMKKLILELPDEIKFDYIPNGVGYLRTAYLKFHPGLKDNTFKFTTIDETAVLKLVIE